MRTTLMMILCVLLPPSIHAQTTTITIIDSTLIAPAQRLGINVGGRSWWGADQIMKNLIDNPGFESGEFASIVLADDGATGSVTPMAFWDPGWNNEQFGIGWPEGFWDGAEFEFLWGTARGRSGIVARFGFGDGRNEFDLGSDGPVPQRLSVLRVRRNIPGLNGNTSIVDATSVRPGSPGKQSLRLVNGGFVYRFYMDSLWRDGDPSAGKLLVIKGEYVCRLWAKGSRQGDRLRIRFFREGEGVFLDESIPLDVHWQLIERQFFVPEGADPVRAYSESEYHPILAFIMEAEGSNTEILVDDLVLESTSHTNPTAFTDNFVSRLKELRPGILRYWAGQLGSSLESQLAVPFARKTNGYSPHERTPGSYCYSLHEFLELCREVDAKPWYVIPPTFSAAELRELIEYLSAPANPMYPAAMKRSESGQSTPWSAYFDTMYLEFGNELWGSGSADDPFMGSSVNGGERLGAIAHDRFSILRSAAFFDPSRLQLVIGGQAGYAGRQREIELHASTHDVVALAPYFGILDTWRDDSGIFAPLFASPFWHSSAGSMRENRDHLGERSLALYEINFHTTHGASPIDVRNSFVSGAAGSLALPLHMLTYARDLGAHAQCAFSSLGYSFRLQNGDRVRLWGMLRDVESSGRKRPTWLGVELSNKAIIGNFLRTDHDLDQPMWTQLPVNGIGAELEVPELHSFAFAENEQRGLVLFNLSLTSTRRIRLQFPGSTDGTSVHYSIAPASLRDNNEDSTSVTIDSVYISNLASGHVLDLPPHSIHALTWRTGTTSSASMDAGVTSLDVRYRVDGSVVFHTKVRENQSAELELRDVLGRKISSIATGIRGPGPHLHSWTPTTSGLFIAILRTASGQSVRSFTVVR